MALQTKDESAPRIDIVGTWRVTVADAPFAYHMFTFHRDGTMQQTNPPAGNTITSDSAGLGMWQEVDGKIVGQFEEFRVAYVDGMVTRGVVEFTLQPVANHFTGSSTFRVYTVPDAQLLQGPVISPVSGERLLITAISKGDSMPKTPSVHQSDATSQVLSSAAERAVPDPIASIFAKVIPAQAADPSFVSFAAGSPDNSMLPNAMLDSLIDTARSHDARHGMLNYTMPQGFPPLRVGIAHLLETQGVACNPDAMLVTSGGMEAISLVAQMLLNPGDTVLVESPAYAGALATFALCGANIVHVECDDDGMTPTALKVAIAEHHPKLVSLMPDYQNPTGKVMPESRRAEIGDILTATKTYAVEDGVYSLLRFAGKQLRPLQSYAPDYVLYATSVSKILAPAMRVGALVAAPEFIARAASIKSAYNMQASGFNQAIAAEFLNPDAPFFRRHLESLQATYGERYARIAQSLATHFPESQGWHWTKPDGGMFVYGYGPAAIDTEVLFDAAVAKGVAYVPGSAFYADGEQGNKGRHEIRLNFASTPEDKIAAGIERLAQAFKTA